MQVEVTVMWMALISFLEIMNTHNGEKKHVIRII